MTTLEKLAVRLGVIDQQLRIKDGRTIVAIAGARGMVKQANYGGEILNVMLYADRDDMLSRHQLIDAGVIVKLHGSTGLYRLTRPPLGTIEREAFCALLGLTCKRERAQ